MTTSGTRRLRLGIRMYTFSGFEADPVRVLLGVDRVCFLSLRGFRGALRGPSEGFRFREEVGLLALWLVVLRFLAGGACTVTSAAASSSRLRFRSSTASLAAASLTISSIKMCAKLWASPCTHASNTPSHSRVGTGKSRLRYIDLMGGQPSFDSKDRRGDGDGIGAHFGVESGKSLDELEPRDRTAFENSRTMRFVPGTLKLVPTTRRMSAPLRPFPFDPPTRSLLTTSPTPSPSLCISLYNTTLGRSLPTPRARLPTNCRVSSICVHSGQRGGLPDVNESM